MLRGVGFVGAGNDKAVVVSLLSKGENGFEFFAFVMGVCAIGNENDLFKICNEVRYLLI